jgi:tRNA wybutosine-synthesizing protein 4
VHENIGDTPLMDFNSKNFRYVTEAFGRVMEKMAVGGRLYLRSLSREKPSEYAANLNDDFPALAKDFVLPKEIGIVMDRFFSSVLRLSGRANMWLHYDVSFGKIVAYCRQTIGIILKRAVLLTRHRLWRISTPRSVVPSK